MKRVIVAVLIGITILNTSVNATTNDIPYDTVDEFINQEMTTTKLPGVAITFFSSEEILSSHSYGTTEKDTAMTADTSMVVGSLSKTITAYLVDDLVAEGDLNYSDSVNSHLSDFAPINSFDQSDVQIQHLINHTSGISSKLGVDFNTQESRNSIAEQASKYNTISLDHPIGEYEYSNANYVLLAAIVESVTGQTYSDYSNTFFTTEGLDHTVSSIERTDDLDFSSGFRRYVKNPIRSNSDLYYANYLPAMSFISTTNDYAGFLQHLINSDYFDSKSLETTASLDGYDGFYSQGYLVSEYNNSEVLMCQGGYYSSCAYWMYIPSKDIGFVVLMNMNTMYSKEGLGQIPYGLLQILMDDQPEQSDVSRTYYVIFAIALILALAFIIKIVRNANKRNFKPILTGLSLISDGAIIAFLLIGLPMRFGLYLNTMQFIQPDLYYATLIVSGLGIISILITVLSLIKRKKEIS